MVGMGVIGVHWLLELAMTGELRAAWLAPVFACSVCISKPHAHEMAQGFRSALLVLLASFCIEGQGLF